MVDRLREGVDNWVDRETVDGMAFALPYLVIFTLFLLVPLVYGLYVSFFDWNVFEPAQSQFIGIQNYADLFSDERFLTALKNTVYFVGITVPVLTVGGLLLALGANQLAAGRGLLTTIIFSPYMMTAAVASLIWANLLSTQFGPVNYALSVLFDVPLEVIPQWLDNGLFAMPMISLSIVWFTVGFNFIILLAARQNVPTHLYEAARLDGANRWNAFWTITLPQMRNALLFVIIVQFIKTFQLFAQPLIMTDGGPGNATESLMLYLYRTAFQFQDLGYAAAMGYVMFMILVVISIINFSFLGGEE